MGEGGISHRESPGKAREGAETAPKGGPHVPAQPSPGEEGGGRAAGGPQLPPPSLPLGCPRRPSSTQKLPPTLRWAVNHMPSLSLGPSLGEAAPSHAPLKTTVPPPLPRSLTADHYLRLPPEESRRHGPGLQVTTDLCLTSVNFGALYNPWLTSWSRSIGL